MVWLGSVRSRFASLACLLWGSGPISRFGQHSSMFSYAASADAPQVLRDRSTGRITVAPKSGKYQSLVVLTHGLGDSAEGFEDVALMFAKQMKEVKFILPTAPRQPVTLNGGMVMTSWYDITGLSDRASESCDGIHESASIVQGIMDEENAKGIPYSRMVLAGFSQGGALSLFTGLQLPAEKRPAGVLVMSGYLAGKSKFNLGESMKDVPVLHCHGTADPMVRLQWARETKAALEQMGATNYELREFPGMQHTVSMDVLQAAFEFIDSRLQAAATTPASADAMKEVAEKSDLGNEAVKVLDKQEKSKEEL